MFFPLHYWLNWQNLCLSSLSFSFSRRTDRFLSSEQLCSHWYLGLSFLCSYRCVVSFCGAERHEGKRALITLGSDEPPPAPERILILEYWLHHPRLPPRDPFNLVSWSLFPKCMISFLVFGDHKKQKEKSFLYIRKKRTLLTRSAGLCRGCSTMETIVLVRGPVPTPYGVAPPSSLLYTQPCVFDKVHCVLKLGFEKHQTHAFLIGWYCRKGVHSWIQRLRALIGWE